MQLVGSKLPRCHGAKSHAETQMNLFVCFFFKAVQHRTLTFIYIYTLHTSVLHLFLSEEGKDCRKKYEVFCPDLGT